MTAAYTTTATAEGGRDGRAALTEGGLALAFAIPKEMGGAGNGSNPEQLFALGYAACFNSALLFVARAKKVDVSKAKVTAQIGIGPKAGGGFQLEAALKVHIPGVPTDEAKALVDAAHQVCPYSNATRGNMPVSLDII
ncbi:organic hydroperoxide resistance protein [Chelatococcus reniformis]|uniref:Organic hydroperoxide resistance protein n=1 Tax=Chelatococcus reniformis TaxID=1494448 RepID=A0A916U0C6_9HYPH|nr:organic hydroperoxide resistance protein [Chelatococcus reniformis]GGC51085.1 organic hydroperoxide resistance protein [Chelatococcus reniformis]